MSASALQSCLMRQHAHAALAYRLDEELGTHHGLGWSDFVLLALLDEAGGALPTYELAACVGRRRSHFVLQVLPLEKTGLVARTTAHDGTRQVVLRRGGRRLLREARETAESVCAGAQGDVGVRASPLTADLPNRSAVAREAPNSDIRPHPRAPAPS